MVYVTDNGADEEAFEQHLKRNVGKGWVPNNTFRELFNSTEAKKFIETRERVLRASPLLTPEGQMPRHVPTSEGREEIATAELALKQAIAGKLGIDMTTLNEQIAGHDPTRTRNTYKDLLNSAQGQWGSRWASSELAIELGIEARLGR